MISNKKDLYYYMDCDKRALKIKYTHPRLVHDAIWKYQIFMRKSEYWQNCGSGIYGKILEKYYKLRLTKLGQKLGFSIGLNTCGPGLSLVHYGTIVIHQNARLGSNCRIQEGVTVGSNASAKEAPLIGNNVYIGSGAKIIGDVCVADNVVIGANAVVTKSISEKGITVAGVPAKKISDKDSRSYIVRATDEEGFYENCSD